VNGEEDADPGAGDPAGGKPGDPSNAAANPAAAGGDRALTPAKER
jgi:hypothetical protein